MKKIVISVITLSILVIACSTKPETPLGAVLKRGSLQELKAKRTEVLASYDSIAKLLTQLEIAIAEKDSTQKYTLVTSYTLKDTVFKGYLDMQGNVETAENILIYPEYQGVLTRLYVKKGQRVKKGQLLARIDDGGLSSQLAQLEAQYALNKTTYERQKRLWEEKIGSEIQYLQTKTNMEASQNAVKQLRSQLGKTTINAPFSGVIDEIITEQGQVVAPGMAAIMRLVNLDNMYVKAAVPENYIASIVRGTPVKVTFGALNKTVEGKVRSVSNFINPSNRTFDVEVDVPNKDRAIKPNLMAQLHINYYSREKSLVIPANCIQENAAGDKYVFVLTKQKGNQSKAVKTKITVGSHQDGYVEVLNGLEPGTEIVLEGALTLKDGELVRVASGNTSKSG